MFRVHYSSSDLAERRGDYYIADTLLKTWATMSPRYMLLKSYGLYHTNEDETFPIREWYPESALNPPADNSWYDQFEGPEGMRAHHPPFGHDFKTGQLLYSKKHGDGRPESMHPLDYMMYDMHKEVERALQKQNVNPAGIWSPEHSQVVFGAGINRHNTNAKQKLPGINSVLWRMNTASGYDGDSEKTARNTTTPDGRPINYSTNQGNLSDLKGADQGMFIDGGVHPMWQEVAQEYDRLRQMYAAEYGVDLPEPSDKMMPYLTGPKVALSDLTFNRVRPVGRQHAETHFQEGGSGMVPGHKSGKVIENYHGLDSVIYNALPKALFSTPTQSKGGKERQGDISRAMEIQEELAAIGVPISIEDAEQYAEMPVSQLLIGGPKHQVGSQSASMNILRNVAGQLGVDMGSGDYKTLLSSINTRERGKHALASRHLYAIPWMRAQKLIRSGEVSDPRAAYEQASAEFRDSDYEHPKHTYDEGRHNAYLNFANTYALTPDHQGQRTQVTGKLPERHADHPDHGVHTQVPPHAADHVFGSEIKTGSPTGDKAAQATETMLARNEERPPPPQQAVADTPAPAEPHPIEVYDRFRESVNANEGSSQVVRNLAAAYPQRTAPGRASFQQRLDDGSFVTSEERTVSDLLKTMERIQLKEARQDTVVKSLVQYRSLITKSDDVSEVAQSLGISVMDVHGIYHSHGDWHRVASDWNVGPEIVKAIKVTFGGGA